MSSHHNHEPVDPTFGTVAEFDDPDALLSAANRAREAGFRHVEAYSPFPIHGMDEALKFDDARLPWATFLGGLGGCAIGFLGLYYTNVVDYPWNVGGRPLFSWPQFLPITYECTILFAALSAFFFQFALNGLPKPYHSIFNTPNFARATQDRFFLLIEKTDPQYDSSATASFLSELRGVINVSEVEK
jgi:hypothetical protein